MPAGMAMSSLHWVGSHSNLFKYGAAIGVSALAGRSIVRDYKRHGTFGAIRGVGSKAAYGVAGAAALSFALDTPFLNGPKGKARSIGSLLSKSLDDIMNGGKGEGIAGRIAKSSFLKGLTNEEIISGAKNASNALSGVSKTLNAMHLHGGMGAAMVAGTALGVGWMLQN